MKRARFAELAMSHRENQPSGYLAGLLSILAPRRARGKTGEDQDGGRTTSPRSLLGAAIAALLLLPSPIPARDGRFTSSPIEIKSCEEVAPRCRRAAVCCRPRCGGDVNLYREHHQPGRLRPCFELGVVASTSRRSLCFPPRSVLDKDALACRSTYSTNVITGFSFFGESEGVRNDLNRGH